MSLKQRVSSGIIFGIVMIASTIFSTVSCFLIYLLMGLLSVWELNKLLFENKKTYRLFINISLHLLLVSLILLSQNIDNQYIVIFLPLAFILLFIPELYTKSEKPFTNIAHSCLILLYIGFPVAMISYMCLCTDIVHSQYYVLAILVMVWANDVFAYFVGSSIGKTKLFERISPNKTWEGTLGGVLGTMLTGLLFNYIYTTYSLVNESSMIFWILLSFIASLSAIFGDLIESLFKRSIGIKDSGHFLPGHGGVLDRFDAFLFASPLCISFILFYIQ